MHGIFGQYTLPRCGAPLAPAKVGAAHRVLALTANMNSVRNILYCIEEGNNL